MFKQKRINELEKEIATKKEYINNLETMLKNMAKKMSNSYKITFNDDTTLVVNAGTYEMGENTTRFYKYKSPCWPFIPYGDVGLFRTEHIKHVTVLTDIEETQERETNV
jgi:ABC-type uncharacterized transport system involved in gliding motility auxiliary subunit